MKKGPRLMHSTEVYIGYELRQVTKTNLEQMSHKWSLTVLSARAIYMLAALQCLHPKNALQSVRTIITFITLKRHNIVEAITYATKIQLNPRLHSLY